MKTTKSSKGTGTAKTKKLSGDALLAAATIAQHVKSQEANEMQDAIEAAKEKDSWIARGTVLIVRFHEWGRFKTIEVDVNVNVDQEKVTKKKELVPTKKLSAVRSPRTLLRNWMDAHAIPFGPLTNAWIVPNAMVDMVAEKIEEFRWMQAIEAMRIVRGVDEETGEIREDGTQGWTELVAECVVGLRELGNPNDYPSPMSFARSYGIEDIPITFETPAQLKALSPNLYAQKQAEMEDRLQKSALSIQDALREAMLKMVQHLAATMSDEKKTFHDTTLSKVTTFLDEFAARNICGDGELEALVEKSKQILAGVEPAELRNSARGGVSGELRARVATEMNSVEESLRTMLVKRPVRKISFRDDD